MAGAETKLAVFSLSGESVFEVNTLLQSYTQEKCSRQTLKAASLYITYAKTPKLYEPRQLLNSRAHGSALSLAKLSVHALSNLSKACW